MSKYKVVDTMALDLLEEQVNSLISDGWEPLGSILLPSKYLPEYHQAMIKRDKLQLSSDTDDESNTQTKSSQSNDTEPDWAAIMNKVVPEIKTKEPMTYTQKQDRLYPNRAINAYEFFKENQAILTDDGYPVSMGLYQSIGGTSDRYMHIRILSNNALHAGYKPVNLNVLRDKYLLYVQDGMGYYELVVDTNTDYSISVDRLNPKLFK